jgi:hypothetical protein
VQSRRKAVPPAPGGEGESVFVGNYEEVLTYPKGWAIRAAMATDDTEIIRFFPANGPEIPDEAFAQDDMASKQLVEIVVFPKRTGMRFKSLHSERVIADKGFKKDGVEYSITDEPNWPTVDAFRLIVTKPYSLMQVYSQSDRNIFLLSAGIAPENKSYTQAVQALIEGIRRENGQAKEFLRKPDLFAFFKDTNLWATEILLVIVCAVLWLIASRRSRLCAMAMFAYAHVAAMYGVIMGVGCYLLGKPLWIGMPAVPLTLLMPWINEVVSRKLGGTRLRRVFWWAVPLALFFGLVFFILGLLADEEIQKHWVGRAIATYVYFVFAFTTIFGLCLGLTHGFEESAPVEKEAA